MKRDATTKVLLSMSLTKDSFRHAETVVNTSISADLRRPRMNRSPFDAREAAAETM